MKYLLISVILATIAQTLTYFQSQSQFFWPWAKDNPLIISLFGIPVSYIFIYFTKYCAMSFDGQVWPGRLIGFAIGAVTFAILSSFIMGEQFSIKTIICLSLASLILLIQIIWK